MKEPDDHLTAVTTCCWSVTTWLNFFFFLAARPVIDHLPPVPDMMSKHDNAASHIQRWFLWLKKTRALETDETNLVTWNHQSLLQSGWRGSGARTANGSQESARDARTFTHRDTGSNAKRRAALCWSSFESIIYWWVAALIITVFFFLLFQGVMNYLAGYLMREIYF